MARDLSAFYQTIHEQYGDLVAMRLGAHRYFVVFHPDAIRELLVAKARPFHMGPTVRRALA